MGSSDESNEIQQKAHLRTKIIGQDISSRRNLKQKISNKVSRRLLSNTQEKYDLYQFDSKV